MPQDREPITIFPVVMDSDEGPYTDFRPHVLPADAMPEVEVVEHEEEVTNPKDDSAPGPASSPESPSLTEPTAPVSPAPPPAARVTSSPKAQSPGSSAS